MIGGFMLYKRGGHAIERRFHAFEKGFHILKKRGIYIYENNIIFILFGVHAFENLIPTINVLTSTDSR